VRIAVEALASQGLLGVAQGRRRAQALLPQGLVELGHQLRRGLVIDRPQAGDHPGHAGVEEAAGEAHETFATDLLAEGGPAAGEHDQVGVEVELIDVGQAEEALPRVAGGVGSNTGRLDK